jgi:hypothetical protein
MELPKDYDKKITSIGVNQTNYFAAGAFHEIFNFIPTDKDSAIINSVKIEEGKDLYQFLSVQLSTGTEKALGKLGGLYPWDKVEGSEKKQPQEVQPEFNYFFKDSKGRFIGLDQGGLVVVFTLDSMTNKLEGKIIAEYHNKERYGACINKAKDKIYYIDPNDASKIWEHNLITNKRQSFFGQTTGKDLNPDKLILLMTMLNDETLFITLSNNTCFRFDIDKKQTEGAIQLDIVARTVASHLNFVVIGGEITKVNESGNSRFYLLNEHLLELGRYEVKGTFIEAPITIRCSIMKTPIIFFSMISKENITNPKAMNVLRPSRDGKLVTCFTIDTTSLKGDCITRLDISKNVLMICDKQGLLAVQIKGEIDDPDKMEELAEAMEDQDDFKRDEDEAAIKKKLEQQKKAQEEFEAEEKKRQEQELKQKQERDAEVRREMDMSNQIVGFETPIELCHKVEGKLFA